MTVAWAPTTANVGAIVPQRTQDPDGDFTTITTPSATQVTQIIGGIVSQMTGLLQTVDPTLTGFANLTASIGTAALVELQWTAKGSKDDTSKYLELWGMYETMLMQLGAANSALGGVGGPDDVLLPVWGFPDPVLYPVDGLHTDF